jgi:hypothetical protein
MSYPALFTPAREIDLEGSTGIGRLNPGEFS